MATTKVSQEVSSRQPRFSTGQPISEERRDHFFMPSGSLPDHWYKVERTPDGWMCECAGFQFHNDCSHVRALVSSLDTSGRERYIETAEISQFELAALSSLERQVEVLNERIKEQRARLIGLLQRGATVEAGDLSARVVEFERRSPAWKQAGIKKLGQEWADRVLAATKPEIHTKLVIE